jgi:hypothetical protein
VSDPAIADKISKMKERVRWQDPVIQQRGIDQTRLVLEDSRADNPEFSFLVIGDSGTGSHRYNNPQREVAELLLPHLDESSFMLHTGDVVYLVGSSEFYPDNFIKPYRKFIVGGEDPEAIAYDKMTFNLPILPVLGNHDYYNLPFLFGLISLTTLPVRRLLKFRRDFDLGWHGSNYGDAYARAFLDYLKALKLPGELDRHLDRHYTAKTETGYCLHYKPGDFTRLPNRYYTFRYGGIDFFALDSNTFNHPIPVSPTQAGEARRQELARHRDRLEQEKSQILDASDQLNPNDPDEAEQLDDLQTKLSQVEEIIVDLDKQLAADRTVVTDTEQLDWLQQRLIESWHTDEVRGRVLYFHHPPYVTEATKWQQAQTLAVRDRLRGVLNQVAESIGSLPQERPIVNLIINGHAHCLEHLQTKDTGHADSNLNWLICGGSGYSLRRQRKEGADLMAAGRDEKLVARSRLFVGRSGHKAEKRRPYSCLRIDVRDGRPPKFIICPFIAERSHKQWHRYAIAPFTI